MIIKTTKGAVFIMKKRFIALFFTFIFLIGLLTVLPVHGESGIYENVLRLHVLANSDSNEDQALKLKVRDSILKETELLLREASSRSEAEKIIMQNISLLEQVALETIKAEGYDYAVTVEISEEEYPTKNYESASFPAGEYLSLKIKIGAAEGQNWWCVLFPPLCLSAATDKEAFTSVGITDDQYQIITETNKPKYKIKFKILESFNELIN